GTILGREREVEDLEIGGGVLALRRFGDGGDALLLDEPAQRHLAGGFPVFAADGDQSLIGKDTAARDRRVSREHHAVTLHQGEGCALRQERVIFDLVAEQLGLVPLDRFAQQRDSEIADADEARLAGLAQLGEGAERLAEGHLRIRPMNEQQIDMVEAETLEALLMRALGRTGVKIAWRDFGHEKNLAARNTAVADGAADLGLIAIDLRRVNMAIAERDRAQRRLIGGAAR